MPEEVKMWEILDGEALRQVKRTGLDLEDRIERWLEQDVSILSDDLLVIGRQVITAHGGRIDLLCLDSLGDVTIIELKRDKTPRETTAQVLDYGSWVTELAAEEITGIAEDYLGGEGRLEEAFAEKFGGELPEVLNENQHMVVVASEIDDSSARIIGFLSEAYGVGINAVTFNYFRTEDGKEFLARVFLIEPEQAESNTQKAPSKRKPTPTVDEVCARADRAGTGREFREILEAAQRHGLYPRPYTNCVMYTPPNKRNRALFTVWLDSRVGEGALMGLFYKAWPEFYPITEEEMASIFGPQKWRENVTYPKAEEFLQGLDRLFETIEQKSIV